MSLTLTRRAMLAAAFVALLPAGAFALTDEEKGVLAEISKKLSSVETMNGEFAAVRSEREQRRASSTSSGPAACASSTIRRPR